ncbi:hypothetical protein CHUAL_002834 [Chamberlinius hualienensis]
MEINHLYSRENIDKVESVKKLLQEDSSLNMTPVGEYLIIMFLFTSNCDVKKAKERLLTYFKYKKQFPKVLKIVDVLDDYTLSFYRRCILTTDVNQEKLESPLIVVFNGSNANGVNLYDGFNLALHALKLAIYHSERVRRHGLIIIVDVSELSYSLLLQVTPTLLYQVLKSMMKIMVINAGVIIAIPLRAVRLLLPESLNEMFVVHSDSWDCLKDEIPSESLPIERGGTNGTIEENNG